MESLVVTITEKNGLLHSSPESAEAGSLHDHMARQLVFERPAARRMR